MRDILDISRFVTLLYILSAENIGKENLISYVSK
jgi:hypothetical protein